MASPLVQFRAPEEDAELLGAAARKAGMKRADWLRSVTLAAARAELGRDAKPAGPAAADPYPKLLGR